VGSTLGGCQVREWNRRVASLVARRGVVCFHCLRSTSIVCFLGSFAFFYLLSLDSFLKRRGDDRLRPTHYTSLVKKKTV